LCGTLALAMTAAWCRVMCLFTELAAEAGRAAAADPPACWLPVAAAAATPADMATIAAAPAPMPMLAALRMPASPSVDFDAASVPGGWLARPCANPKDRLSPIRR